MSGNSKSLLFLLQRCVAVRQLTSPAGSRTRAGVLSARCGFIQQRTWASSTRTVCLQRLCQLQSALKTSQYSFCTKVSPIQEEGVLEMETVGELLTASPVKQGHHRCLVTHRLTMCALLTFMDVKFKLLQSLFMPLLLTLHKPLARIWETHIDCIATCASP